ncbi:MAG: hypothetical protein RIM80_10445, partial [Alphaproteobacteria bacterium]
MLVLTIWRTFEQQTELIERSFLSEIERTADQVALGMARPLRDRAPEAGVSLAEAAVDGARILGLEVRADDGR